MFTLHCRTAVQLQLIHL